MNKNLYIKVDRRDCFDQDGKPCIIVYGCGPDGHDINECVASFPLTLAGGSEADKYAAAVAKQYDCDWGTN